MQRLLSDFDSAELDNRLEELRAVAAACKTVGARCSSEQTRSSYTVTFQAKE
jgi:hypothetical protein